MKKLSVIVLVVILLLVSVSTAFSVSAATSGTTGACTWELDGTTLTISGNGAMGNYDQAYSRYAPWGENITTVVIKPGVTGIGDEAFYYCMKLNHITIPDSVTSIGDYAFYYCMNLNDITIPDGVTFIGRDAFSVTAWRDDLPDGLTYAGKVAYKYKGTCPETVVIKEGTTEIASGAFAGRKSLNNIAIPNSVTYIGASAFYGCSSLKDITLPNSVTFIGETAFSDCTSLTNITIPAGVTSIDGWAFYGCSSLNDITIEEGVTAIGESAFSGCTSLTDITLPDGVTAIGGVAFGQCTSLTHITLPDSVTAVGGYAFDGTAWYDAQPDGLVYAGKVAYAYKGACPETVVLKEGSTGIAESAFYGCTNLKNVTIPDGVTSIGAYAFCGCTSLTGITVPDSVAKIGDTAFGNTAWYDAQPDGLVYAGNMVYRYKGTCPETVMIDEGVTGIADFAFCDCTNLKNLTIPDSVTAIGLGAFDWSENLTIYGLTGSYAEQYAKDNDIPFVCAGAVMYGDANGDNIIDTADLVHMKKLMAGLLDDTACSDGVDANGDGTVDTADLVALKKYLAGLIDTLG